MAKKHEIGATLTLRDNMSPVWKGVKKEQDSFRKDVLKTRQTMESSFNKKMKMKLDNSEFLWSIKDAKKDIDKLKQEKIETKANVKLEKQQQSAFKQEIKLAFRDNEVEKIKNRLQGKKVEMNVKTQLHDGSKINALISKIRKPYYFTLAVKDLVSNKVNSLVKKPKKIIVNAVAKTQSAMSNIRALSNKVKKPFIITAALKDMATSRIKKVSSTLNGIGKKVFSPSVKVKDNISSIMNKLGGLKAGIAGIAAAIGAAALAAGTAMISSGADLEKQQVSMKHFIGINNKDKSDGEVNSMRDSFLGDLRKNANETPFETGEVVQSGTRALGITGGNMKDSMELVKVAEDMAALTPGKTVSDAMEALADAKNGEMERLKEFNAKVSSDDYEKLGFKGVVDTKLKSQFEGGSQKLSQTGAGQWSTIKGNLKSKAQDIGLNMLEKMKPLLSQIITFLDSPEFDNFSTKIGNGISFIMDKAGQIGTWISGKMPAIKETIGNVTTWIGEKFGWIGEKTGTFKDIFMSCWNGATEVVNTFRPIVEPIFNILADGVKIVWDAFELAFPAIKKVVETVWGAVKPILDGIAKGLQWMADNAGKLKNWLDGKIDSSKNSSGSGESGSDSPNVDGSHANGLDRVPFDGYIAELHKDETVLTKSEAKSYKQGRSNKSQSAGNIVIAKLADKIVVREESDIDKIVDKLVDKLLKEGMKLA